MTFHTIAYFINAQGVKGVEANVIQDDVLTSNLGTRFFVPAEYNYVHRVEARGTLFSKLRISTPSLEIKRQPLVIMPVDKRGVFTDQYVTIYAEYYGGLELVPTEELRFLADLDAANAPANHYIIVWLGPREPRKADVAGSILARATFKADAVAQKWTTAEIQFDIPLEVGNYQVVGAVAYAPGVVVSRLIMPGSVWRPPVTTVVRGDLPGTSYSNDVLRDTVGFDYGTFAHNVPPKIQVLADTSGAINGVLYLYLKRSR